MPNNWKTYKLGEILKVKHGYAFKGKHFTTEQNDNLLLTPGNFNSEGGIKFNWGKQKFYNGEIPKDYILNNGDLILALTDLTQACDILGAPAIINDDKFNYLHNQRLGLVDLEKKLVARDFLFYFFNTTLFRNYLIATKTGSTVSHTAPERIYNCELNLPPLPEQKAIAQILSAIDDKIENNLAINKTLEDMAMALYKHWFVDFGPFQDGEFIDSELGKIPKGWEVKRLNDLAHILNSKRVPLSTKQRSKRKGEYPYYGASGIIDNIDDFIFDGEHVIISEDGENLRSRKTPIGFSANGKFWVNNHAHILQGKQNGINKLIICHIAQMDMNPYLTGAVQPKLNKSNLLSIGIAMPKEDSIIQKILDEFFSISRLIFSNGTENQTLTKLRDTLLPKLISGEIRLKEFQEKVENIITRSEAISS